MRNHAPRSTVLRRAARAAMLVAAAIAACVPFTGCDLARSGRELPAEGPRGTWRWRPVALEVSALTTPIPALGERRPAIDVRLTCRDEGGDETKAVGVLRIWIRQGDTELAQATVDLAATEAHARAWDGVTETYAVRMDLPRDPEPRSTLTVRALLECTEGGRLEASADVRWPERPR